jgi:hypothetical protein
MRRIYLELALRHSLPFATLDDELILASKAAGSQCFSRRLCCRRKIEMTPVVQSRDDTPLGGGGDH